MLFSEYIKKCQETLEQDGDHPCYYARDDEGNEYQEVGFTPSLYYVTSLDHRIEDLLDEEDIQRRS